LNIAIFTHRMVGYAGVELYTYELSIALASIGHRVSVHVPRIGDAYRQALPRRGVELTDDACVSGSTQVCIAPSFGPVLLACETGRPVVQVLHSEHPNDVPTDRTELRGVVTIRAGQWPLVLEKNERHVDRLRHRMIRNPIDYKRFSAPVQAKPREFESVIVSEFDWFKSELARRVSARYGKSLLLVGPWYDREHDPPEGSTLVEGTLDTAQHYQRARKAISYRLSRCVPEAIACGCRVVLRGELEPKKPALTEGENEWRELADGEVDLASFDSMVVARQWTEFLKEIA